MPKDRISAVVITKNEKENIKNCLESIKWVDEIIIIDAFSSDSTVELCRQYTDKIYQIKWLGYSKQKNFGIEKAQNNWILSVDADERITDDLKK